MSRRGDTRPEGLPERLSAGLHGLLSRHRAAVLVCALALALLCALQLSGLRLNGSSAVFLPDTDAEARLGAELLETSPASGLLLVDVEARDTEEAMAIADRIEAAVSPELARSVRPQAGLMTPDLMLALLPSFFTAAMEREAGIALHPDRLEESLRQGRELLRGPAGLAAAPWVRGDPLGLRTLMRERLPEPTSPLFSPSASRPVSADGCHTLLMLAPARPALDADASTELVVAVLSAAGADRDGVCAEGAARLRLSGAPLHTAVNARVIRADIERTALFSLAGFALAYLLLARSLGAGWILLTAAYSALAGVAATSLVWPAASGLVLGFGAGLMGLSEDYAVHMHFALRSGNDERTLYATLLPPLAQGWALNVSGFAVLLLSSLPALRQTAFFSVSALTAGFAMAVLLLPWLPRFTAPKNIRAGSGPAREPRAPRASAALAVCILLAALCALLLTRADFDFSPRHLEAESGRTMRDAEAIRALWRLDTGLAAALAAGSRDEALLMSRQYAAALRAAGFTEVTAPSDFLPTQAEARENCARWKRWFAENRGLIEHNLALASARTGFSAGAFAPFLAAAAREPEALGPDSGLLARMGMEDMAGLALFRRADDGWCALVSFAPRTSVQAAAAEAEKLFPAAWNGRAGLFSSALLEERMAAQFGEEQRLLCAAGALVLALLMLFLRRPGRVWVVFMPPLLSLAAALALFRLLDIPLSLASLAALPVVVGLAVDHGIMITHTLETGREAGVRRAVVLSSITAFLGMGLLAFADHPALRSMGLVIFAGLLTELAAALFLVPLLYAKAAPAENTSGGREAGI
ncbi:MAG: hypothetical protein Q4F72_05455 [Desulfovibrionaceae bacterium]|nr:hypothetical protein [Desulfovibrionaceae bacterium]